MALANSPADKAEVIVPGEWDLRLGSPSKINLFLRIIAKRTDGAFLCALLTSVSMIDIKKTSDIVKLTINLPSP